LIKTDPDLSRVLGFKSDAAEAVSTEVRNWSFEYLVAGPKKNKDGVMRDLSKQDSTVTIALVTDGVFRWKVEAVVQDADRGSSDYAQKACEALNEVVSDLLTERLEGVAHFQREIPTASTTTTTPMMTPMMTAATVHDSLPRYEDLKR